MSDANSDPEGRNGDAPWWETGQAPERIALPERRGRRLVALVAIVVGSAIVGLVIWAIVVGASSKGSMTM
jgi:hypothetical protein